MKITKSEKIRHNVSRAVLGSILFITPFAALAQYGGINTAPNCASSQQSLCSLVTLAIEYFNEFIYLIIALAVLTFIWNVYRYFIVSDPENKTEASKYVMYSVIGLFVILSFWGLVNIVSNTLNLDTTPNAIDIGSLTGNSGGSSYAAPGSNGGGTTQIFNANLTF